MDVLNERAVVEQTPDLEFTPYPDFIEDLPGMAKDFFRNPLPEQERRRYLAQCPRNMEREYSPPVLNHVQVSQATKRTDAQLADIQFRLSSLTRPGDYFLHMALQQTSPSKDDFIDFANAIHELLSDTASHITQIRIDNMCQSAGIRGQALPITPPTSTPLLDPKVLLEHVSLAKSTMQLDRQTQGSAYHLCKPHLSVHSYPNIRTRTLPMYPFWKQKFFRFFPNGESKKFTLSPMAFVPGSFLFPRKPEIYAPS